MNDDHDTELRSDVPPPGSSLPPLELPVLAAPPVPTALAAPALHPAVLADLMLASPLRYHADFAALEPLGDVTLLRIKRGNAALAELHVPADVGQAAIVRLALSARLDPLLDGSTPEGRNNVARVAVRAGADAAEVLVFIRASAAGLDAELRAVSVNGRAIEPASGGHLKRCTRCHAYQAPQRHTCELDGGRLVEVDDDPSPGGVVGTYLVHECLGEGAAGAVFAGEHALIGRPAAIKVLRTSGQNAALWAGRFLSEARAACRVRHPSLVEVFDYGLLHDGRPFIVMERLAGESLSARMARQGALPPEVALRIAREVALALGAAHDGGVVHNDVKPSNIMLLEGSRDEAPRVKLIDFGAAGPLRDAGDGGGFLVGTVGYMAPERVRSEPTDGRADLYSLGVVLYEMLSGALPFRALTLADFLLASRKLAPPPLVSPFGVLPRAVSRLSARALAVAPDERHQTAREMAADLEHVGAVLEREGFRRWLP